ncbi:MAG TPA: molybdopterin molybdenumtransferase MoeA, partial [Dehalococcoidia bacterium]|nr:molybdopterin molybdenumtransferase MoeA [Dehalococcoidia bacterium]
MPDHQPSHSHSHGHSQVAEDMLTVEEALERILASFLPLEPEEKPLLDCLGQVLASAAKSPLDLPPLANSGMDGYAVLQSDIRGASGKTPKLLKVIGTVAAGHVSSQRVRPGTAIRIMTGAPIPEGADTVVPFEETDEVERRRAGQTLDEINVTSDLPVYCNIRPSGEDVQRGQLVLEAGTLIRAAEVGVLA